MHMYSSLQFKRRQKKRAGRQSSQRTKRLRGKMYFAKDRNVVHICFCVGYVFEATFFTCRIHKYLTQNCLMVILYANHQTAGTSSSLHMNGSHVIRLSSYLLEQIAVIAYKQKTSNFTYVCLQFSNHCIEASAACVEIYLSLTIMQKVVFTNHNFINI